MPMLIELCDISYLFHLKSMLLKFLFLAEWDGIQVWLLCRMGSGGEDTEDRFMNISALTRWPNTNLSKDGRSKHFYVGFFTPDNFFHHIRQ